MVSALLTLLIMGSSGVHAQRQGDPLVDSLRSVLRSAKEDTNKVIILNMLSEQAGWRAGRHDSAIVFAGQAEELANRLLFYKGLAQAHSNKGMAYYQLGRSEEAMSEHRTALETRERIGDKAKMGLSYGNIGHVHKGIGDHEQALRYYTLALEMAETTGELSAAANWLNHIGSAYLALGDYPQALASNLEALRIQEAQGDSTGMSYSFNNIATIHLRQRSYDDALTYSHKALDLMERMGDGRGLANTYNKLGTILSDMGQYDEARKNYEAALAIYVSMDDQKLIAASHGNIGVVYYQEGNLEEALKRQRSALDIFERINEQQGLANTYANIGSIHLDLGKPAAAAKWYSDGLALAEKIGSHYTAMQLCQGMMDAYVEIGDYRSALESHKRHIAYRDSLYNENNTRKLTKLEMQYNFDRKEAAAQAEQEKKDALALQELRREKLLRNGSIGGSMFLALFAGVFLRQRNRIGREKQRSEELLLNILPKEVAEELKVKGEAEARQIDQATVLFTDFKGFTALSESLSPKELVRDLHECFSAFDRICDRYGLEKIKTIGDAYMAAGGLPSPNSTHATDVIQAALEMRDFIAEGKAGEVASGAAFFEIRIGVHTGPVVAGIVGVKKFQYDIWGDTVNTASRMESSGEVGQVNISEATYALVRDQQAFVFSPRGHVMAKGKGEMRMFFVDRKTATT